MSEFERARRDSAGTDSAQQRFPEDFSADEAVFASQLRDVYPLEQEIMPPHFIQTVMEDGWRNPTPDDFEQKLIDTVFQRLELPRPQGVPQTTPDARTPSGLRRVFGRAVRPVAVSLAAVVVMMVFSVVLANPSFAAGVQYLLSHTGARQVDHYPANVHAAIPMRFNKSASLNPTIPIYWLGPKAGRYAFQGAQALPAERWSNGPIIDVQYSIPSDTPGTGLLDIREFQVASDLSAVLQTVQTGSAKWLLVNGTPAVYVDGMWTNRALRQQPMPDGPSWKFGGRSELMLEQDGIVFWIVGDQRDGANQEELVKLAGMLTGTNSRILHPNPLTLHGLGESFMQVFQKPEGRELLDLVPRGATLTSDTGIIVASDNYGY
jgi:hypothetical protein